MCNVHFIMSASYQCMLPAGMYATKHSAFTLCTVWATTDDQLTRASPSLALLITLLRTSHIVVECD